MVCISVHCADDLISCWLERYQGSLKKNNGFFTNYVLFYLSMLKLIFGVFKSKSCEIVLPKWWFLTFWYFIVYSLMLLILISSWLQCICTTLRVDCPFPIAGRWVTLPKEGKRERDLIIGMHVFQTPVSIYFNAIFLHIWLEKKTKNKKPTWPIISSFDL